LFLKSLELYGFKSFADKTRLEFADGTTSLLGPNGCGKSNIVDAIKWVLGEQSTRTLRAGKMEDVIFNGTEKRKAMNVAEVTLVINNEDQVLPSERTEVEIKRRLFRSGESEFFINREQVRLRDIRELFFDTGVGKSAYSILEQGKIDQILSHKPEDRRYIFEEAAGITRYKLRSLEAQRKLERTEENIEQVETLLKEIKRQYDSRKTQVNKLLRYREYEKEMAVIEVDVQLSAIKNLQFLEEQRKEELEEAKESYDKILQEIADIDQQLKDEQSGISEYLEKRMTLQSQIYSFDEQIRGKEDQLVLLNQRYTDFKDKKEESERRARQILDKIERDKEQLNQYLHAQKELEEKIDSIKESLANYQTQSEKTINTISTQENEINEKEEKILEEEKKQHSLAQELQSIADEMAKELDLHLSESGYSTAVREEAEQKIVVAIENLKAKIENNDFKNLKTDVENLETLFTAYGKTIPTFIDQLIAPEGVIGRKHQIDHKLEINREAITKLRTSIFVLRENNKELNALLDNLRDKLTTYKVSLGESVANKESLLRLIENLQKEDKEQNRFYNDAVNETQLAHLRYRQIKEQIDEAIEEQHRIKNKKEEFEISLEQLISLIENENEKLKSKREKLNELYQKQSEVRSLVDKFTFHIESIKGQIEQIYISYFESWGISLKEHENRLTGELEDVVNLRERLNQLKKQIQSLGYINHMAEEEYNEIKERHDFLAQQMGDLEKAKNDLTTVIVEIRKRSEELFIDSFNKIRISFQEMFHRMFGGGRADLRLLDTENILESGIDILAQPPGKKLDRLAPLSGGEKSLTAVALLFATYKVKPSPFCVLDEIDASLDDRNIGYFLTVLEEFSSTSQFIIITHNKHTVMGSKTLLGVTMQEKGVSKAISYKMGWQADKDVIYEDKVDIDLDNTV
jgi:chromosome segregation protein